MIDRRRFIAQAGRFGAGAAALGLGAGALGRALAQVPQSAGPEYEANEIVASVENFFGSTSRGIAEIVEKIFGDLGKPNAFIAGEEASAAIAVGLRYGDGWLYRKGAEPLRLYWQGPSIGFDAGLNASKTFTLVYDLADPRQVFQRFPGVEGTYYFIAGIGVNYLRSDGVTLAPMRTGVGARAGLNVGYLHFTPEQEWFPL